MWETEHKCMNYTHETCAGMLKQSRAECIYNIKIDCVYCYYLYFCCFSWWIEKYLADKYRNAEYKEVVSHVIWLEIGKLVNIIIIPHSSVTYIQYIPQVHCKLTQSSADISSSAHALFNSCLCWFIGGRNDHNTIEFARQI